MLCEELVRMENIEKTFPGVKALNDVSFQLLRGEVHALVGENGAGKSTLMKVLIGQYKKDKGKIFVKGKEVQINNIYESQKLGIAMIHQELNLMNHLTVAQNIFIGREQKSKIKIFLDDREIIARSKAILDELNVDIDPNEKVGNLTIAKQQMVEIAKALACDSDILIMDEPTASLTDSEIEDLFRIIRKLKNEGKGIIYISHRLEELKQISDRITVMRDGKHINTVRTDECEIDEIIKMMVGRVTYVSKPQNIVDDDAPIVLEVKNIKSGKFVKDVSFYVRKGEILGIFGLVGAGRTETARAIFGADKLSSGEIFVHGKKVDIKDPFTAIKNGIAYLPEDRKRYGLILGMEVDINIALANMNKYSNRIGLVKDKEIEKNAKIKTEALDIRTPSMKQLVKFLSGGNQQKVVIAKWLTKECDILIFDEPTRGIDVGAKSEIYKLLNQLANQGKAIIVISSELPEILRISNRILVMCEGRVTANLNNINVSEDDIMRYATQRN